MKKDRKLNRPIDLSKKPSFEIRKHTINIGNMHKINYNYICFLRRVKHPVLCSKAEIAMSPLKHSNGAYLYLSYLLRAQKSENTIRKVQ